MPAAIALAGAAFSASAGMAAIGAAGGLATAGGLLGGLMVAGGALGAVGALTGNKKLSKIGGILSLVGGVGSLGQSLLKETAGQAGSAAGQAAGEAASATAGNTVGELAGTAGDVASTASNVAADAAKNVVGDIATADAGLINSGMASPVTQALSPQAALGGAPDVFSAASSPFSQAMPADLAGYGAAQAAPQGVLAQAMQNNPVVQTGKDWMSAAGDKLGGIGKWAQANPAMAKIMGQGVLGAAQAYSQEDAMKRQMRYQDLIRQRYSDSVRNLTIPPVTAPLSNGIIGPVKG